MEIEKHTRVLGERLERFRLLNNLSQAELAKAAGIGVRTLRRLESGEGGNLDTLVRVLMALKLEDNLLSLIPDHSVRPVERIRQSKTERQRASGTRSTKSGSSSRLQPGENKPWAWGDEVQGDETPGDKT